MQDWKSIYWKRLNVLSKFVGALFIFVSAIVGMYGITMFSNATQTSDAWMTIILSLVVASFGFLLIKLNLFQRRSPTKNDDIGG